MYVERGEVGKGAMARILELVEATASRAGRDRVLSTKQGLELALLISGDDGVPGVQAPACRQRS